MATRNGKIAQLPTEVREQLNLRLFDGEPGRELIAWLNALPVVQTILGSQFNGSDISEVNLTHWRQGGYLQWLTERECFDSARALAEGDCHLATTGLSAERLLNVLTLRFGQLLMRWDTSPDEGVSEAGAFSMMARKARILQGISRSLLAIHRLQSQSARQKSEPATFSANSRVSCEIGVSPSAANAGCSAPLSPEKIARQSESVSLSPPTVPESVTGLAAIEAAIRRSEQAGSGGKHGDGRANLKSPLRKGLSGPIAPLCVPLNLSHSPFMADRDLSQLLGVA
jgi:hypothetical protein